MSRIKKKYEPPEEIKNRLPVDFVNVFGTVYNLLRIKDMVEDTSMEGFLENVAGEIVTDEDLRKQLQSETTVHEIVHAYALKLAEIDAVTETHVILITTAIFDFIANNYELARCLVEMGKKPK